MPAKKKTKKDVANEAAPPPAPPPAVDIEPVVMQLPIQHDRIDELMGIQDMDSVLEYNPSIMEPQPYQPTDTFHSRHDMVTIVDAPPGATDTPPKDNMSSREKTMVEDAGPTNAKVCFWCCHNIEHMEYGMPVRYDVFHKNFTMFGTFCSLECAAAYNYSVHMGSDRVWEIHSWIQMLAHRYGYSGTVRPAPSRYLLKMFNGPMSIEEFRSAHKGLARTYVLNIPPFIHVSSHMEILNTSFLDANESKVSKPIKKKSAFIIEKQTLEAI